MAVTAAVRLAQLPLLLLLLLLLASGAAGSPLESGGAMEQLLGALRRNDSTAALALLARSAPDPNALDPLGRSLLYLAAQAGDAEVVRALLAAGAEPNVAEPSLSNSPLDIAAQGGHVLAVRALVAAGADVSEDERAGPLYNAVSGNQPEVVRILLDAGADPGGGKTLAQAPVVHATVIRKAALVGLMAAARANVKPASRPAVYFALQTAAIMGYVDVIRALQRFRLQFDPDGQQRTGTSPLQRAASMGHAEAVRALLEGGQDPNKGGGSSGRYLPLSYAVRRGDCGIAQDLLRAGARPRHEYFLVANSRAQGRCSDCVLQALLAATRGQPAFRHASLCA